VPQWEQKPLKTNGRVQKYKNMLARKTGNKEVNNNIDIK
jgi:hypothetical protein